MKFPNSTILKKKDKIEEIEKMNFSRKIVKIDILIWFDDFVRYLLLLFRKFCPDFEFVWFHDFVNFDFFVHLDNFVHIFCQVSRFYQTASFYNFVWYFGSVHSDNLTRHFYFVTLCIFTILYCK